MQNYCYNLGQVFSQVAHQQGAKIALRYDNMTVSYAALEALSNQLSHWLLAQGIEQGQILAIINHKSRLGFALMLACLKLGVTYVNIDVNNPPERLRAILNQCQPSVLMSDQTISEDFIAVSEQHAVPCYALNAEECESALSIYSDQLPAQNKAVTATTAAYMILTSGSTGHPKGVMIAHSSVINFIAWARQYFGLVPEDVLTSVNPLHTDNAVFDFYSSVFNGATLAVFTPAEASDLKQLIKGVNERKCTLWFSVPSLLIYLLNQHALTEKSFPSIRVLAVGGESCPKAILKTLYILFANRARLVNLYGPAECTCIASAYEIKLSDFDSPDGTIPLGQLCDNFDCILLNAAGQSVPKTEGAVGELCLLGANIGLGYIGDADKTASQFCLNPLNVRYPERIYRTGDLVKIEQDQLHFLGRVDNQIKHMGYRIELEEIEVHLAAIDGIEQVTAVYARDQSHCGQIVAFIVTQQQFEEEALRATLSQKLPFYMLPSRFNVVQMLPVNANGKVDRHALEIAAALTYE